ncbi:MAG: hypothetical protein ACRCXZ_10400, partial [Patescibacteria group bacterium]
LLFEQINNILQDNRLMKLKLDGYKLIKKLAPKNSLIMKKYLLVNPNNGLNIAENEKAKSLNVENFNNDESNMLYYYTFLDQINNKNSEFIDQIRSQSQTFLDFYNKKGFIPSKIDSNDKLLNDFPSQMNNTAMIALMKMIDFKKTPNFWQQEFINVIEYDYNSKVFTTIKSDFSINDLYLTSLVLLNEKI